MLSPPYAVGMVLDAILHFQFFGHRWVAGWMSVEFAGVDEEKGPRMPAACLTGAVFGLGEPSQDIS